MNKIAIKRIYEKYSDSDGYRMLVDRLWPRGVSKVEAKLEEWNKEIAPSTELRKWFDHQDSRFVEFSKLYEAELDLKTDNIKRIRSIADKQKLTLLYSAKNTEFNQALVLKNYLNKIS